jgi:hypothetical protein
MRRIVGTLLILLFWLGPLAAILPANGESRLPACCRRHGIHHCTMPGDSAAEQGDRSTAAFSAPSRCPRFPDAAPASTAPAFAFTAIHAGFPAPLSQIYSRGAIRAAARQSRLRTESDRGPPAPAFA